MKPAKNQDNQLLMSLLSVRNLILFVDSTCFMFVETSNDEGECFFPFSLGSFQMYFCEKTDPDLPATCPTFNETGPRINCSEGIVFFHQNNLRKNI
jgi:hypothetical protein